MKLAVTVLTSILFTCSFTTASPVNPSATTDVETSTSTVIPSATTSTESSTSPTPNPNGIGLDGLDDALPDSIKELLEKYVRLNYGRDEQKKKCDSLKPQYEDQQEQVTDLETKIQDLEEKSQENGGGPEYNVEIRKTKLDLEIQKVKLEDIRSRYMECKLRYDGLEAAITYIKIELIKLVFGIWDPKSFERKITLIGKHPSVQGYFVELASKGQSSGRNKSLNQKSGGRRKHRKPSGQQQSQDSQPSSSRPSGSGSLGRRVSSSIHRASSGIRRGASRLVGNVESYFQRPESEDREPLI